MQSVDYRKTARSIKPCDLPPESLLHKYRNMGAYTDCFVTCIDRHVAHDEFVQAFYTTWLFKLERLILKWVVAKPSSDDQARQLALGRTEHFAAWRVENRCDNQLLMSDFREQTRSWLMVIPDNSNDSDFTLLFFGSAVVPTGQAKDGSARIGITYRMLLGLHKFYSVALLWTAARRLKSAQT